MNNVKIHMLGIPHSICNDEYGMCAFTTKVRTFPSIVQPFGWNVVEYSNGKSLSDANEHVVILTKEELEDIQGKPNTLGVFKTVIGSELLSVFHDKLIIELRKRVRPGDIIAHPYGPIFKELVHLFPKCYHVETGIGYLNEEFGAYRIFESYSWMHYNHGYNRRWGNAFEWVIPNGFDSDLWNVRGELKHIRKEEGYLLFVGRVVEAKGMHVIKILAEHLQEKILVAGLGSPELFSSEYIEFLGNVVGREKLNELYKNARAVLMPTQYNEPLGFVAIESMMCGTPIITSDFGSFPEIVEHGKTGFRCHTLGDYIKAIEEAPKLDRDYISRKTKSEYSLERAGIQYDNVFQELLTLKDKGWYNETSFRIKTMSEGSETK